MGFQIARWQWWLVASWQCVVLAAGDMAVDNFDLPPPSKSMVNQQAAVLPQTYRQTRQNEFTGLLEWELGARWDWWICCASLAQKWLWRSSFASLPLLLPSPWVSFWISCWVRRDLCSQLISYDYDYDELFEVVFWAVSEVPDIVFFHSVICFSCPQWVFLQHILYLLDGQIGCFMMLLIKWYALASKSCQVACNYPRFMPPPKSSTRPSYLCISTLLGSYALLIPGSHRCRDI